MTYTPLFKCKKCGNDIKSEVSGELGLGGIGQGFLPLCSCEDAVKTWEQEHRVIMERRKKARRK